MYAFWPKELEVQIKLSLSHEDLLGYGGMTALNLNLVTRLR
jgi:hypothetical protein